MTYSELDQVIVSVALLATKPGVFVEDVRHLLVIATSVEVFLLAVLLEDGGLSLLPSEFRPLLLTPQLTYTM